MSRSSVQGKDRARSLSDRFAATRGMTDRLVEPLTAEDCVVQTMPDVSPTKWHMAHVTWFFETFVLKPHAASYRPFHAAFEYLYNSYYNGVGEQYPRPRRGLMTRPTLDEIRAYRAHVDRHVLELLAHDRDGRLTSLVELGLHHEQQHQELLLMDIKHVLSCNPLRPAYREMPASSPEVVPPRHWIDHAGGLVEIGHAGSGFSFDNEQPRHRVYLAPFRIASRLVTNGEYREFIEDGGYTRPECWLADGWATVEEQDWTAPLYWLRAEGAWHEFTLGGERPLDSAAPVCHVSFYEACAYAEWASARLPQEGEWEVVAAPLAITGNFLEAGRLHPRPAADGGAAEPAQLHGDTWEWTRSAYAPYPGFRPASGAIGEYNGKFMCNQYVLRGGCCVTSGSHVRTTYRNFFYPYQRWPFSGIRLASDA